MRGSRLAPLVTIGVALFLVLAVLPSALNTPQSNPSTTLEYAPVPPQDRDANAPNQGNLSALGLTSGNTTNQAPPILKPPPIMGKNPSTKRCVGSPPKQTEDPNAPPCVAFFEGDNFGATYQGVTKDEIRVLFYFNGGAVRPTTSKGNEQQEADKYYDLRKAPVEDEFVNNRMLRILQRYFNERFQTYNRNVHFFVHYGKVARGEGQLEARRADAAEDVKRINPFAVIAYPDTYATDYASAMAHQGVVNFLGRDVIDYEGRAGQPKTFYRQYPGLVWSFDPSLNKRAELFTSYVCKKVLPYNVSFSGNAADANQPRRLGLLSNKNPEAIEATNYAALIKKGIEACGGHFAATATFENNADAVCGNNLQNATTNMAAFQQQKVTTIVWGGGLDVCQSVGAHAIQYTPEWVLPGDTVEDANIYARTNESTEWAHARIVSSFPRGDLIDNEPCYAAAVEVQPDVPRADARFLCGYYKDVRQLFTGIQVAGPKLTPGTMDEGFHAIPQIASNSAKREACFYEAGDYSCVKDAQMMWWDPTAHAPARAEPGCWRMMLGGKRFLAGQWPAGDVEKQKSASDACNGQNGTELTTS